HGGCQRGVADAGVSQVVQRIVRNPVVENEVPDLPPRPAGERVHLDPVTHLENREMGAGLRLLPPPSSNPAVEVRRRSAEGFDLGGALMEVQVTFPQSRIVPAFELIPRAGRSIFLQIDTEVPCDPLYVLQRFRKMVERINED